MIVINLFAGPGAGKSTTAAGLFNLMKHEGMSVEYVSEYAKDLTWQGDKVALGDQLFILGQQEFRQARLLGQVDYCITDSPLLLSRIYQKGTRYDKGWMRGAAWGAFRLYNNISFFVERVKEYDPRGRNQTEYQANHLDLDIMVELKDLGVWPLHPVKGDKDAPYFILERLTQHIKELKA